MKYQGIIFDLDGTIVDTVYDLHDSLNYILENNNFPKIELAQTRDYIGNGLFKLLQRAFPEEYKDKDDFINEQLILFKEEYNKRIVNKSKPYPHIEEIFHYCNENNIPIGVASNKSDPESELILKILFPNIKFCKIIGQRQGAPTKPNPGIIFEIIDAMNLNKNEILYIGDSITDYQTAQNSDLDCVLVTYGYENREILEKLKVKDFVNSSEELKEYIIKHVGKNE